MARPLRLEFAGALYHVTSRGNRREDIFDDDDRKQFLLVLQEVCNRHNWICHAYCLMSNHYHLLIETPDGNLSRGMGQLNGVYTQYFNRRHGRVGHVFQGRYKGILVDKIRAIHWLVKAPAFDYSHALPTSCPQDFRYEQRPYGYWPALPRRHRDDGVRSCLLPLRSLYRSGQALQLTSASLQRQSPSQ